MKMVGLIDIKRGDVHAETRKGRNGEWQDRWQDGYCQVGEEVRRIKITLNRDDGGSRARSIQSGSSANG